MTTVTTVTTFQPTPRARRCARTCTRTRTWGADPVTVVTVVTGQAEQDPARATRGDDIEETAFHALDFVGSVKAGKHLKLKLKVRNILNQRKELHSGVFLTNRITPGVSASLGLVLSY